jgi:carboxyl-terminal processing protease
MSLQGGPMSPRMILIALLLGARLLAPTAAFAQSASDPPLAGEQALATLDEVWTLVHDRFYDPDLKGVDWDAVGATYREQAATADSQEKLAVLINRMLHELPTSHLGYYTPADTAYYDLIAILSSNANALEGGPAPSDVSYAGIGVFTRRIDGKTFITGLLAGFAAERAGLLVGDEIIDVDGMPFAPVASFQGTIGTETSVAIRRTRDGPIQRIIVVPETIVPSGAYREAMEASAKVIEAAGFSIGYVRGWTLYDKDYVNALLAILLRGSLSNADALILDMRDGWGGGSPDFLQYFDRHLPLVQLTDRGGTPHIGNTRWRAPVVLLVNQGTRSMKEIFAYGFQKYGYGDLVGERTAGAVLGARGILLEDGLLILPMFSIQTDGETLEGRGVAPTVEVPFDIRYAEGRDPQLDRAVEALVEKLRR